jgi:hypothetical protein
MSSSLREQLADTSLALCTAGLECRLYEGTAPRHAVRLHSVKRCAICGGISNGLAHGPVNCNGFIGLGEIFAARAPMREVDVRHGHGLSAFRTVSGPLSGNLHRDLVKYLHRAEYVVACDSTPVAWYVPNPGHAYGAHPAIWYVAPGADLRIVPVLRKLADVECGNIMVIELH